MKVFVSNTVISNVLSSGEPAAIYFLNVSTGASRVTLDHVTITDTGSGRRARRTNFAHYSNDH
jgi:hypothetical protein